MNRDLHYDEALAADRRAARRQLDLALAHQHEPVLPPVPVAPTPVFVPPPTDFQYCVRCKVSRVSDHSIGWMLVVLLMMTSSILTILLFVVLFVTGIIGGGGP